MTDPKQVALLKQIQLCDFILTETGLYLDTHKTDQDALAYFQKHRKMAMDYRDQYIKKYGPLIISDNDDDKVWKWVDSAWPWEYESEA